MVWTYMYRIVASELNDPICHSDECQIGSFSSEATVCTCMPQSLHLEKPERTASRPLAIHGG